MAFDPATGQLLLFGGFIGSPSDVYLSDTWAWTGTDWSQLSPTTSPPARGDAAMAFDPRLGRLVLFGGRSGSAVGALFNDTWVWGTVTPPVVQTNPQNVGVVSGQPVQFTASATGDGPIAVRWQVSTAAVPTFTNIPNQTSTTLNRTPTTADSGNQYRAVFTNAAGAVSTSAATLTVSRASTTTDLTQQAPIPAPFGSPVNLRATVTANAPSLATPTGSVQFKNGAVNLGPPVSLVAGVANLQIPSLLPDQHISAIYAQTTEFFTSSGNAVPAISFAGTISGNTRDLALSGGPWLVSGANVQGKLTVAAGTSVYILNSTIASDLVASNPGAVFVCNSAVHKKVQVSGASGNVVIGDPGDDGCGGNTINDDLTLSNDKASVDLVSNHIGGKVLVTGITGLGAVPIDTAPEIGANTISVDLNCSNNAPAPVNGGQTNTVGGNKSGQCALL